MIKYNIVSDYIITYHPFNKDGFSTIDITKFGSHILRLELMLGRPELEVMGEVSEDGLPKGKIRITLGTPENALKYYLDPLETLNLFTECYIRYSVDDKLREKLILENIFTKDTSGFVEDFMRGSIKCQY